MALIQLTFDPEKIIDDLRRWTTDPKIRKMIVKKIDEWTETGVIDAVDQFFIDDAVKKLFTEKKK